MSETPATRSTGRLRWLASMGREILAEFGLIQGAEIAALEDVRRHDRWTRA